MRNLLYTGGWAHDFKASAPVLGDILADAGVDSVIVDDVDEFTRHLIDSTVDLVTIYACWSRLLDPRYSPAQRTAFGRAMPLDARDAVIAHLERGGPLLGVHTASICFDDWPRWPDLLGVGWVWGRSGHPPLGEVRVEPVGNHPIVDGLETFAVIDERYSDLEVRPAVEVLATSPAAGVAHPVLWSHTARGRVVYDALGHDERSLTNPGHARILRRTVRWLAGDSDDDVRRVR